MLAKTKDKVSFSRQTWDELYEIDYFREVLEMIEDIEALKSADKQIEYYVDYDEYRTKRLARTNV